MLMPHIFLPNKAAQFYKTSWICCASFILGIFFGHTLNAFFLYALWATIPFSLIAIAFSTHPAHFIKRYVMSGTFFLLGALNIIYQNNKHENFFAAVGQKDHFIARVIDVENWRNNKSIITVALKEPKGMVRIHSHGTIGLTIGDVIEISNLRLYKPNDKHYDMYLKKEFLKSITYTSNITYNIIRKSNSYFWSYLNTYKNKMLRNFNIKMDAVTRVLFFSIFLGTSHEDQDLFNEIRLKFNNWGLTHFLARSGLHLSIIALFLFFLMRTIPLYFYAKKILIFLMLLFYGLMTFSSVSFIRAFLTQSAYLLFIISNLPVQPMNIFILITFGVLLANPFQLFFLDFQLSFGITFLILIFTANNSFFSHKKPG